MAGYAEKEHISDFAFETQRRNYHAYGQAIDPSKDFDAVSQDVKTVESVHGIDQNAQEQGANVWYNIKRKKRRRAKNEDAGDIDNWQGPWAKYKVCKIEFSGSNNLIIKLSCGKFQTLS